MKMKFKRFLALTMAILMTLTNSGFSLAEGSRVITQQVSPEKEQTIVVDDAEATAAEDVKDQLEYTFQGIDDSVYISALLNELQPVLTQKGYEFFISDPNLVQMKPADSQISYGGRVNNTDQKLTALNYFGEVILTLEAMDHAQKVEIALRNPAPEAAEETEEQNPVDEQEEETQPAADDQQEEVQPVADEQQTEIQPVEEPQRIVIDPVVIDDKGGDDPQPADTSERIVIDPIVPANQAGDDTQPVNDEQQAEVEPEEIPVETTEDAEEEVQQTETQEVAEGTEEEADPEAATDTESEAEIAPLTTEDGLATITTASGEGLPC